MEILLVDHLGFTATRFTSGDTLLKCAVFNHNPRTVRGNQSHDQYLKKLLAVSKGRYCIHIGRNAANPSRSNKCVVRLHGSFLQNFETLWKEGLKVRIQLAFSVTHDTPNYEIHPLQICVEILIPKPWEKSSSAVHSVYETCVTSGVVLEAIDVSIYDWIDLFNPSIVNSPEIVGSAAITLLSDSENVSHGIASVTREFLDSKLSSDVIISAKDGSEHNCIKAFLAAQSSVFKAMLQTDMKESKTNRIEMNDMTSDGVKALLKYLYTFELDQVIENCDLALELLEAGHKYDIKSLEKNVSSLILNQLEDWFSVDLAFNLFLFTRKVESMKGIQMRVASVLMKKSKEFMECKTYMKEREENPVSLADAVQELFCLLSSSLK